MHLWHMITNEAACGSIRVARSGTPKPATARLLCGPQPTNLQLAEVLRKHPKLLLYIGFSRHVRYQKELDTGHFLSLFLNSLFIGSNGQALLPVAGAHVRDESLEFIEVDSPMPPEYGAGINLFSPL